MQLRGIGRTIGIATAATAIGLVVAQPAFAHVKWFSDFDFRDPPRTFGEVVDSGFLIVLVIATLAIGALPAIDRWLEAQPVYARIDAWLHERRQVSDAVVRYSMAAVLFITWASEALLTPELDEPAPWVGWVEFVLAVLLLAGVANQVAGAGLIGLWFVGVYEYGAFHMLDYVHVLGIGTFLILRTWEDRETRGLAIPVLYASVGFSLMWLGFEKLVYPEWSFAILDTRPMLRLGIPAEHFLDLAAFVEIALGFLLIIGLLGRPLALTITLVFISTTLVFGRVEVIGHTPVHAALVVFLLYGPGTTYPAPIAIHRDLRLRTAFAAVNFVIVTLVIGLLYAAAARAQFDDAVAEQGPLPEPIDVVGPEPEIDDVMFVETMAGTDVIVEVAGWTFAPPATGPSEADGVDASVGFGIVSVDGATLGRIDTGRTTLLGAARGETVTLSLFTVDGRQLYVDGEPLRLRFDVPG